MLLFLTSTPRFKCSLVPMAFFAVLFSPFFGAVNGLASQQLKALRIQKAVLVGDGWPALSSGANMIYHYYIGDPPSYLEAFPELWGLKQNNSGPPNYIIDYVPYGTYPLNLGGYIKYPYFYRLSGSINAGTVPDDFSDDDLNNLNASYNNLPEEQKFALNGNVAVGSQSFDGQTIPVFHFDTKPVGTSTGTGGVFTYDSSGNVVQSFPDGSGYASGFKQNADGSYTPVYYKIDGNTITESPSIPTTDYSSLTYDSESGQYTLDVPDYSGQLDAIISRIDNIDLRVTVPAPEVTVNPEVNVTVPAPEVTVNPEVNVTVPVPEVTVELPDTISDSLTAIEGSLSTIVSNTSVTGSVSSAENFSDLEMSSEEQSLVNDLVSWETNIPLIGEAVDFGLTAIMGKIPAVGTEYVWLDYTIGGGSSAGASGRRGLASFSNPLSGYRVLVSLANYQDLLQATRGTLILFEALYFVILIFKLIHKALLV